MAPLPPGTIDLHLHAGSDGATRRINALGVARDGGLAGAVFKGHHAPTAAVAALVRQEAPSFAAFGSVTLNHAVGGLNPAAVEALAKVGGAAARIVWLPTRDAANDLARKGRAGRPVRVTEGGGPVPALLAVAEAAASHGLILASGHLAPAETVRVFRALANAGMRLLATHVTAPVTPFAPQDVAAVLDAGAYVEICARNLLVRRPDRAEPDLAAIAAAAELVRRFGTERLVLSSDLGDARYPDPVDGLAAVAQALARAGVAEALIEAILVTNTRLLVGNDERILA